MGPQRSTGTVRATRRDPAAEAIVFKPEEASALVQSLPAWLVPALGGVVVLLLFIVMAFLLGWTAGDVLKVLGG